MAYKVYYIYQYQDICKVSHMCHENIFYVVFFFSFFNVHVILLNLSPDNDINFRHRYFSMCYSYLNIAPVLLLAPHHKFRAQNGFLALFVNSLSNDPPF